MLARENPGGREIKNYRNFLALINLLGLISDKERNKRVISSIQTSINRILNSGKNEKEEKRRKVSEI